MLEPQTIQLQGFRNIPAGGSPSGFQVRVRCPYYRGIWASLLENVTLSVDDESFSADQITLSLGGKTYTLAEFTSQSELRWPFEEAMTLTVEKPGGLEMGLHRVKVWLTWRWSYIPVEMQPTTNVTERQLVLVH